jgi:uncharacterized protein
MSCNKPNLTGVKMGDRGPYTQLVNGKPFFVADPRPEEIDIEAIAHALSLLCRYGGHCKAFYSVAQHSVLVSQNVSPENALWGLLHDAAEGLTLNDMPRGVKSLMPNYYRLEEGIMKAVAKRFNLPWPMPAEVKEADEKLLATEKAQLMEQSFHWPNLPDPLPITIDPWPWESAKAQFLNRFHVLNHGRNKRTV